MYKLHGPLSAVQFLAITHPSTAERNRDKIMRNEKRTLGQVGSMTEHWANRYVVEHPQFLPDMLEEEKKVTCCLAQSF